MNISRTQIQNLIKIYNKDMKSAVAKAPEVKGKKVGRDELDLSVQSKVMQKAFLAAKQADDFRADKVNALRGQISAGTYQVSDDEVAERMISQTLLDQLV